MGGIKITLVVALICQNSVIVGADSQATAVPIRRIVPDKICKLTDSVLMSGAGSISHIQKIQEGIERIPSADKQRYTFEELKDYIKQRIAHPLRRETLDHYRALGHQGEMLYNETPSAEIILAGFSGDKPRIYHISIDAIDTRFDDYHAVGFGVPFAQVVLKNYPINQLTIEQGKVLAYKVIKDAMETGAFSMEYPISLWTIEYNKKPIAKKIEQKEVDAIAETVTSLSQLEVERLLNG